MRVAWFWLVIFWLAAFNVALWASILDRMTITTAYYAGMLMGIGMGLHTGIGFERYRQARADLTTSDGA